jgi:biopolymer transport protein ExbD
LRCLALIALWASAGVAGQAGTVVAWGDNSYSQTNVPIRLSRVVAIASGSYHNVALRADGTVSSGDYVVVMAGSDDGGLSTTDTVRMVAVK